MDGRATNSREVEALLSLTQAGDNDAFVALCEQYAPLMTAAVSVFSDGMCDADVGELQREAEYALYRAAATYRMDNGTASFGLYARVCVRNALISVMRRRGKQPSACSLDALEEIDALMLPSVEDPSARMIAKEMYARVMNLLSSYECRVFDLYVMEGCGVGEIARRLGKTEKSVSNALFRLLQKLRKELS